MRGGMTWWHWKVYRVAVSSCVHAGETKPPTFGWLKWRFTPRTRNVDSGPCKRLLWNGEMVAQLGEREHRALALDMRERVSRVKSVICEHIRSTGLSSNGFQPILRRGLTLNSQSEGSTEQKDHFFHETASAFRCRGTTVYFVHLTLHFATFQATLSLRSGAAY